MKLVNCSEVELLVVAITTILSSGLRIGIGFELTNRDPPFIVLILRNIFS